MRSLLVRLLLRSAPISVYTHILVLILFLTQTIEKRTAEYPDRPLIRISSTFFWHLSSDYDLAPIQSLLSRARAILADQINLGKDESDEEATYPPMKVGQQVQK